MTKIKICGLSRTEDIEAVNLYQPDYVGFVFAESKRRVDVQTAKCLIEKLDKTIRTVGVFVNDAAERVADTATLCGLDVIQLHGDETANYVNRLKTLTNCDIWKAFRIRNREDVKIAAAFPANKVLLDTYQKEQYGGSGHSFNWSFLDGTETGGIILAGGLHADNISEAVRTVSPYMVDVSSGVETNGVKDSEKMKEIIRLVKDYR